jgi:dihydroorotate dehydrogenase (NAD+) catalytic subunit
MKVDLSVKLGGLRLKNPIITASGTFAYGEEMKEYIDIEALGAITVKGLTLKATTGNPTPRIVETTGGILNSIGLENPGLEKFINDKIRLFKSYNVPVIVNISGHTIDEYAFLAERLASYPEISALEINVSCPNLTNGGMIFGTDSESIYKVTKRVKDNYFKPIIVKLSPNVTNIVEMAKAAKEGGADIISMINTLLGMAIDIEKQRPVLGNIFGGLSGPAIKPIALRMVYQVASKIDIPIIGMGGIMSGSDAIEFLMAGASAVAVGTANLVDPEASINILNKVHDYCIKKGIKNIEELKGKAILRED